MVPLRIVLGLPKNHFKSRTWALTIVMWNPSFGEWVSGSLKVHSNLLSSMWSFCSSGRAGPVFLSEVFEMLIASPSPLFFSISPPDSSSNYIRQLETKVRILEDDNNKLLSQVRCTHIQNTAHVNAAECYLNFYPHETPLMQLSNSPKTYDRQLWWDKAVDLMSLWSRPAHNCLPVSWRACLSMFNSWGVSKPQ